MKRPGRVRGHELDVDVPALPRIRMAVLGISGEDVAETRRHRSGIEAEVDEPRTRDIRLAHRRALEVHPADQFRGDLLWLSLERLRQRHREVGRPFPERWIPRALEHRVDRIGRTDVARGASQLVTDHLGCGHVLSPPLGLLEIGLLSEPLPPSDLGALAAGASDLDVVPPLSPLLDSVFAAGLESPPLDSLLDSLPELEPSGPPGFRCAFLA